MPNPLHDLSDAIFRDPGLRAALTDRELDRGVEATRRINDMILDVVRTTRANADGLITPAEMKRLSQTVQGDGDAFVKLIKTHGYDNANGDTGFHLVRGDGGTLTFQGRAFVDGVADVVYHFGYRIRASDGQYVNEDGNANGSHVSAAGWLNYFLNGRNVVWGDKAANGLWSNDDYSAIFAPARNETFYAGAGDDSIGGGMGNDRVLAGAGRDRAGGDKGADRLFGEGGNDWLYGGEGRDRMFGGAGDDDLNGGLDGDRLSGGGGADTLYGAEGSDRLSGGDDRDTLMGAQGNDRLDGNDGADTLSGGDGRDRLDGGRGADTFVLWEGAQASDTVRIGRGDTGRTAGSWDRVEGFASGIDKLDLRDFGDLRFRDSPDYAGGGRASAYYVKGNGAGDSFLFVDANGDRATDARIAFEGWLGLGRGDLILG